MKTLYSLLLVLLSATTFGQNGKIWPNYTQMQIGKVDFSHGDTSYVAPNGTLTFFNGTFYRSNGSAWVSAFTGGSGATGPTNSILYNVSGVPTGDANFTRSLTNENAIIINNGSTTLPNGINVGGSLIYNLPSSFSGNSVFQPGTMLFSTESGAQRFRFYGTTTAKTFDVAISDRTPLFVDYNGAAIYGVARFGTATPSRHTDFSFTQLYVGTGNFSVAPEQTSGYKGGGMFANVVRQPGGYYHQDVTQPAWTASLNYETAFTDQFAINRSVATSGVANFLNLFVVKGATGNVGINSGTPAAKLDIVSTTSGILIPRMTTTQRDAINVSGANAAALEGMEVYNLTTHTFDYWNGTAWKTLSVNP